MNYNSTDFEIETLGECNIASPLVLSTKNDDFIANFTKNGQRAVLNARVQREDVGSLEPVLLEIAGPREKIYFEPKNVKAAIVTCGGLCPGLNNVIRGLYKELVRYGVTNIKGVQFGYMGLIPEYNLELIDLTADLVDGIHRKGGTILGASRGNGERTDEMIDYLREHGVNMLFAIGGDGTQKGALRLSNRAKEIGYKISVVGVPKTIDNDLSFVRKSFGFETAVAVAVEAVRSAKAEAVSAPRGVGLVKVMGRESGFIAAHTAIASGDVDIVLVPEVPFNLETDLGLLKTLEKIVKKRGSAVVLIAEGAGQNLLQKFEDKYRDVDASGNKRLGDIGLFLRDSIIDYFDNINKPVSLKYIDPSYIVRSQPANSNDAIFCSRLASSAVHCAMAGKNGVLVGLVHDYYVHIPIAMAVSTRSSIDPNSELWLSVVEATNQPNLMV